MAVNENSPSPSKTWKARSKFIGSYLRKLIPFLGGMLAAFAGLFFYNFFFPPAAPVTPQDVSTLAAQVLASATPVPPFSEQVYQTIQPSLVAIQTKGTTPGGTAENGLGTGVIIDDKGDVITCLHVVANATSIQLTFSDGTQSNATISQQEPQSDIAYLQPGQLPATLVPATIANLSGMKVGDEVYAVGNPFGLYDSMTAGIISGFDRAFILPGTNQEISGLIQVDAAVNPGNSGGPLLNRDGQVIGIVEGIANPTGQDVFIGISFAIPINMAGGGLSSPLD
jgi:S1-C subfamily serine protease